MVEWMRIVNWLIFIWKENNLFKQSITERVRTILFNFHELTKLRDVEMMPNACVSHLHTDYWTRWAPGRDWRWCCPWYGPWTNLWSCGHRSGPGPWWPHPHPPTRSSGVTRAVTHGWVAGVATAGHLLGLSSFRQYVLLLDGFCRTFRRFMVT